VAPASIDISPRRICPPLNRLSISRLRTIAGLDDTFKR